mgnify:CR=1 FL=1
MAIKKESDKFTASSCKSVAAVKRQFKLMRHAQEASSGTRWGPDDAKRRAVGSRPLRYTTALAAPSASRSQLRRC